MLEKFGKQNVAEGLQPDGKMLAGLPWKEGRPLNQSWEGLAALPLMCRVRAEVCCWALQNLHQLLGGKRYGFKGRSLKFYVP